MSRKRSKADRKLLADILALEKLPSAADRKPELRFRRSVTVNSHYPAKKDLNGKFTCRRCGGPVPTDRKFWCSKACVASCLIMCNPGQAKTYVEMRDRGVCAACGIDTEQIKDAYKGALNLVEYTDPDRYEKFEQIRAAMRALGFPTSGVLWDMDHRLEVVRGGGHCGLSNLETLCRPCHKVKTKKLAGERAAERKLANKV